MRWPIPKQRKQFGKAISEFQGVQFDLAEMAVDVEAARLMTYNAARLRDAGRPFIAEAAMAKYFASQVAERVASQSSGGAGRGGLYERLSGGEAVSRCEDRPDLRGHQQHAAGHDC